MDALLGPDEIRLRDGLRTWARQEFGTQASPSGPGTGFPPDLLDRLACRVRESGVVWPALDPRVPALEPALMLEGVAAAWPEAGFRLAEHAGLCIPFVQSFGRPDQRERFLPALVAGRSMGSWLWVETKAAESRPGGGLMIVGDPFSAADAGPQTAVVLTAFGDGTPGRALETFIVDNRDTRPEGGGGAGFLLPASCRLGFGGTESLVGRAVVQASSPLLLGCFLGAAAGLLESCYGAARSGGAFETLILDARDVQVRLSEARVGLEARRWLLYRILIRGASGPSAEESARLLVETLPAIAGVLDLAGRLEVPGWGPAPDAAEGAGARQARTLITSLERILC